MVVPLPFDAPLIVPGEVAVHVNVVPATVDVIATLLCADEHIVSGVAVAVGTGFIVTT